MTDRPIMFPPRLAEAMTDCELLHEWYKCPPCDELDAWFQAIIDEMERRKIIF